MGNFISSKIILNNEAIAQELSRARQNAGISPEEASKKTRIALKYLKALEKGDLAGLPEGVYGKNYLREYAQFLKVDEKALLSLYDEEMEEKSGQKQQNLFARKAPNQLYFITIPKLVKSLLIAVIVLVCISYLGFYLKRIISPPYLEIIGPPENLTTSEYLLEIRGKTEPEAKITINEELVLTDQSGNFTKKVNLKNGLNTILITAQKKYSKENIMTRKILVESP